MVWYRNTDPEKGKTDGRFTDYLKAKSDDDVQCDPDLFNGLAAVVRDDARRVAAIRERGILPPGTLVYETPLTFRDIPRATPADLARREKRRREWCLGALQAVRDADLVLLDPDNGLTMWQEVALSRPKYAATWELVPYLARNQSVIVYHHQTRKATLTQQVEAWCSILRDESRGIEPWAFSYHRQQVRIYFVIPCPAHAQMLRARSLAFAQTRWSKRHFLTHGLDVGVVTV